MTFDAHMSEVLTFIMLINGAENFDPKESSATSYISRQNVSFPTPPPSPQSPLL